MPNKNTHHKIRRALETVAEVIGIIITILPFFQGKGRKGK